MLISEALLADFRAEADLSRKILKAVPEDRLDFKPHEKSMSLGQLAGHIADTPSWIGGMMMNVFDLSTAMEGWTPFDPKSGGELLAAFEKNLGAFEETISGKSDAVMSETWTMKMGDDVLMSCPRHTAIRSTLIHHVVHHRGQLTVFLRLIDTPVPPTYGPTADFTETFA